MRILVQSKIAQYNSKRLRAITEAGRNGGNKFWKYVSSLDHQTPAPEIRHHSSNLLVTDLAAHLTTHMQELFNPTHDEWTSAGNGDPDDSHQPSEEDHWQITRIALERALPRISASTATGLGGIPAGLVKCLGKSAREHLTEIFDTILKNGPIPPDWQCGRVSLVCKRGGDAGLLGDYRPITVTSVLYRLFTQVLKQAQQQTPTPATKPLPAKTTKPQRPPLGPRNPTSTDQPTWADKVACKGEVRAAQRQGHSPQQPDPELAQLKKRMCAEQAKEIQSLKEELAKQQAPELREGSIISGPVLIRDAKKRAGPTLQAEEQSEFDWFTANIHAILEQYRAETTAEYTAFNAKLESMQKQLIELAAWPAQLDARTNVVEEDLARSKRAGLIPTP
ncbi:hypothetical protein MRX96_024152 [Rhipicephalus microplus]